MINILAAAACWLLNIVLWLIEPLLMLISLPRWLDRRYRIQVLLGKDQLGNPYAAGWADESISARAWRCQGMSYRWHWMRIIIDGLFFWQPNHCEQAWLDEKLRRQMPATYRATVDR